MVVMHHRWFFIGALVWGVLGLIFLLPPPCLCATAPAPSEPTLSITVAGHSKTYKRSDLLAHPQLREVTINDSPAYPRRNMRFRALPLTALFAASGLIAHDATIEFSCLDGYSAPLASERLLNSKPSASIAYLAIEEASKPWPIIDPVKKPHTAGPFYLVWANSKASGIHHYEWPTLLAGFTVKASVAETYPAILPAQGLKADHPVQRGFHVFTKICFTCHTMNLQGSAAIGPDLNLPMNPTEYFKEGVLTTLVRNPQNLRRWGRSQMPAFPASELSDHDLEALLAYLQHMATRKAPLPASKP